MVKVKLVSLNHSQAHFPLALGEAEQSELTQDPVEPHLLRRLGLGRERRGKHIYPVMNRSLGT